MIRVPEDKEILICARYQMFEETGLLVHEDEAWIGVVEEQYNRIKASYDSGKFKQMSDDESLADLCELFAKEVRKARWQRFVFDYPTDILEGLTFEDEMKGQWDAEAFDDLVNAILPDMLAEDDEELDRLAEIAYNEAVRFDEISDSIDELYNWMSERGFEPGNVMYGLPDANDVIAEVDIAWPFGVYGIQRGYTKPVALRVDATQEQLNAIEEQGFTCFTDIDDFKAFITKNYLGGNC